MKIYGNNRITHLVNRSLVLTYKNKLLIHLKTNQYEEDSTI